MSLRHFKRTVTASCLIVAAAVSTASAAVSLSGSAAPEMIQSASQESETAFRGSGRFSNAGLLAYRASGRFHGLDRYMISYRGSERGVSRLAYRASGRFGTGWGHSLISEGLEQESQTLAYRASGRFNGGFERFMISYRGSERGVDTLA